MITNNVCFGQSKDISVGIGLSFQRDLQSRNYNNEEKSSFNNSLGTGIKMIKDFNTKWGLKIEADYIKRSYEMEIPYSHCYFAEPGEQCTAIMTYLESYGYQTMGFNFGIIRYIKRNDKWKSYLNINVGTAFDFKSFYNDKYRNVEESLNELNIFSGSLICNIGLERKLTDQIKLNIEPFVRVVHIQREDEILYETQKNLTGFDNFGIQLFLMFGL